MSTPINCKHLFHGLAGSKVGKAEQQKGKQAQYRGRVPQSRCDSRLSLSMLCHVAADDAVVAVEGAWRLPLS